MFREDIKEAAADWGLECLRYEIKDINVPSGIKAAMELQVGTFTALLASQQQEFAGWACTHWAAGEAHGAGMPLLALSCPHKAMELQLVGYPGAVRVQAMPVWPQWRPSCIGALEHELAGSVKQYRDADRDFATGA